MAVSFHRRYDSGQYRQRHAPDVVAVIRAVHGANIAQVGLFFTFAAVAPLAFQILGDWLSDLIGRLHASAFVAPKSGTTLP